MRYKVGDKIRVTQQAGMFIVGTIGTIIEISATKDETFPYRVQDANRAIIEHLAEDEFIGTCKLNLINGN